MCFCGTDDPHTPGGDPNCPWCEGTGLDPDAWDHGEALYRDTLDGKAG